ncbi:MAG: transglycosylase SLT domain-containing protein, partial [Bosea sp. (in: a-proteobacteria)]
MFLFTTPSAREAKSTPAVNGNAQGANLPATPVTMAIRDGAAKTGTDFGYLVRTAQRESALDPNAKARTSSATGLFQFIDQTWLQ